MSAAFGVVAVTWFFLLCQRASACTYDHLKRVWAFVCFALFCVNVYYYPFSYCVGDIKISKTTSPQHWRFYFALKRNETKWHKQTLHEHIHATRKYYPQKNWVQFLKIREITLDRRPVWALYGGFALALIISCQWKDNAWFLGRFNLQNPLFGNRLIKSKVFWIISLKRSFGQPTIQNSEYCFSN